VPSPPSPSPALLDRPAYARTGAKLGTAVLAFVTGVIAVITLQPFAFAWPTRTSVELWTGPFDPVANVALFVPLGFLFALTRAAGRAGAAESPAARDRWLRETTRHAAVLGGALSGVIELVQISSRRAIRHPRTCSPTHWARCSACGSTDGWPGGWGPTRRSWGGWRSSCR
jgi:hypothetical protein